MTVTVQSAVLVGIEAVPTKITVEPQCGDVLTILGLHSPAAMRETRIRVSHALARIGLSAPLVQRTRVTVEPAVARGSAALDLAIAVGIAAAYGEAEIDIYRMHQTLVIGELGLGGDVRAIRGIVPMLRCADELDLTYTLVPCGQINEAAAVPCVAAKAMRDLADVVAWLSGKDGAEYPRPVRHEPSGPDTLCMSDVRGQERAKRALEIAAAGGHHVLLTHSPGAGATMLARRLTGIMPDLKNSARDDAARLEMDTIASAAGTLPLIGAARPFRAPHYTASTAALIGGGPDVRPGEVTLAHGGVLMLDELPEFRREALEDLGAALRRGTALMSHKGSDGERRTVSMPASALVVGATMPCPCGRAGMTGAPCECRPDRIASYRARLAPIDGLFDLRVTLDPPSVDGNRGDTSAAIRARVEAARERLLSPITVDPELAHRVSGGDPERERIISVAVTIAALAGMTVVTADHLVEADALVTGGA